MTKIIAITNQKGGVGKTTTAVNLSAVIAEKGFSVLLIDIDPQANATTSLGVDKRAINAGVMELLTNESNMDDLLQKTPHEKLSLLPANEALSAADTLLINHPQKHSILKDKLKNCSSSFDWVFIDCPPTLNLLTVNALVAADFVLVPIQCEYFALEGVSSLLDTIGSLQKSVNPSLKIAGFVRTMYNEQSRLTKEVSQTLFNHLKTKMFNTAIPRNVRLAEAPGYGLSIIHYDPKSTGARAFVLLADELLARM